MPLPIWNIIKGASRVTWGIGRGISHFAFSKSGLWGPRVWGIAAAGKSRSILGAVAKRAIGPGMVLGGFGLYNAGTNILNQPYSMESPNVAVGYTPNMTIPYASVPMTFSTANRTTQSMAATGSLAFALHNSRKG